MIRSFLTRRSLLKAGAAGLAASALPVGFARAQTPIVLGAVYVGPRDDFGWNQAHAVAMDILKAGAGRYRRRGRERAGDRRGHQVDGVDDQPRWRQPHAGDLVRLLQTVRRRTRQEISERHSSATPRRCGTRTPIRPTPAAISATSTRRTTWTASPPASRPSRTRSASLPPSRSRRCSPTSTRCCSARKSVNPDATVQVDLHRRVVAARARGRGLQRADRRRLRRHHLPRRRPEGGDRDGREARA